MTLLIISFIAGALTVLAPCILPLLPVIIGGSVSEHPDLRRAGIVTVALGISVFLFTLILKVSTAFINIPPTFWQWLSGGILFFVGLFMLFPSIWENLVPAKLNISGNKLMGLGNRRGGVWGDALIGAALGPVFTSCSPTYFILLAAVLPAQPVTGLVYLAAYVLGLSLALLLIAYLGQKLVDRLGIASDPRGWFKRAIGILFICIGLAIGFGLDKTLQTSLPSWAFGISNVEQSILKYTNPTGEDEAPVTIMPGGTDLTLLEKTKMYDRAPELVSPDAYINTGGEPISIAQYKGKKVVLVDFWTYSCINCLRTTPYLVSWYDKYESEGLVIIGVHTPEFAFEHKQDNVEDAVKRLGIKYPVVLDNEYQTWNAFKNQYWPRKYLVDIDGFIVYDHAGEGEYDKTEQAIQAALMERARRLNAPTDTIAKEVTELPPATSGDVGSPEIYFGSGRNEYFGSATPYTSMTRTFTLPEFPSDNVLYFGGAWDIKRESASTTGTDGAILFKYGSSDVYFVASSDTPVTIEVLRDGKPVGAFAGDDINPQTSTGTVHEERLYKLIHDTSPGVHTIQINVKGKALHAYTFTFG